MHVLQVQAIGGEAETGGLSALHPLVRDGGRVVDVPTFQLGTGQLERGTQFDAEHLGLEGLEMRHGKHLDRADGLARTLGEQAQRHQVSTATLAACSASATSLSSSRK